MDMTVKEPSAASNNNAAETQTDENTDEYQRWRESLSSKDRPSVREAPVGDATSQEMDSTQNEDEEEDEDEYQLDEEDEEDEYFGSKSEEDIDLAFLDDLGELDNDILKQITEELESLEEEDMQAAVATLLDAPKPGAANTDKQNLLSPSRNIETNNAKDEVPLPTTPLRDATAKAHKTKVTEKQFEQLQKLLLSHHQLLVQQAVLSARAMKTEEKLMSSTPAVETNDELREILDGSLGMLHDLDQNRKDAIRHFLQFHDAGMAQRTKRSLSMELIGETTASRRLTRAQFHKTLHEQSNGQCRTVFDIAGLSLFPRILEMTSIKVGMAHKKGSNDEGEDSVHIFSASSIACQSCLETIGADVKQEYLPDTKDITSNFVDPKEFLGPDFEPPCTAEQAYTVRRNRQLFSAGEDNLCMRGVNLYGEKQWQLISERYLPDRAVNGISQRYSKICLMIYRKNGIEIDESGVLPTPPKFESIDDIDEEKASTLKKVDPPAVLNVHRWSLEEDLTLLKAVPIYGNMWAEICARLIPHRDRGHLRKRYQVLERRIKATAARSGKNTYLRVPSTISRTSKPTAEPRKSQREVVVADQSPMKPPKPRVLHQQSMQYPMGQHFPYSHPYYPYPMGPHQMHGWFPPHPYNGYSYPHPHVQQAYVTPAPITDAPIGEANNQNHAIGRDKDVKKKNGHDDFLSKPHSFEDESTREAFMKVAEGEGLSRMMGPLPDFSRGFPLAHQNIDQSSRAAYLKVADGDTLWTDAEEKDAVLQDGESESIDAMRRLSQDSGGTFEDEQKPEGKPNRRGSLLDGVLARAKQSDGSNAKKSPENEFHSSLDKDGAGIDQSSTPSRIANKDFFSTTGTPVMFSPGFHAVPTFHSDHSPENFSMHSFPAHSMHPLLPSPARFSTFAEHSNITGIVATDEADAIDALHSLHSSPAKPRSNQDSPSVSKFKTEGTSLFAKVMDGGKPNEKSSAKKRKLEF